MGLWFAITSGGALVGNLLWLRLINRHGAAWTLPRAALLSAVGFILIGLVRNLNIILMVGLLAGFINSGIDLSHLDTLLRVCPADRRAWYMSVYVAVMNGALFLGPLAVAPLLEVISAPVLMVALGVVRLLGAMLFVINPVQSLPSPVVEAQ
jgi:predicted MFS family arabinose efflux permease